MQAAKDQEPTIPADPPADFWPAPVAHLNVPYLQDGDEHALIAEISDAPSRGYIGMRQLFTCFIPHDEVDAAIATPGGIGWRVETWGPLPCVGPEGGWDGSFWVDGRAGSSTKYEALVHSWLRHDRTVMMPDNGMLMCYGLVPRLLDKERFVWDDASKPIYDVLEVKPLSVYVMPDTHPHAYVRMRRDYLEDYASLKGCAVVAVYYEMRYSRGDPNIAEALGGREGREFKLPGRLLDIRRIEPANRRGDDQLTQVWGCRLILKPAGRPISEEKKDRDLVWPGNRLLKDLSPLEHIFVRDEALQEWESRDEFTVSPNSGDVSYGGWWGTDRTLRWGRHHIRMELRKLYEGTPPYVIRHFHRFAVAEAVVHADVKTYGNRHVGMRATELVDAFFGLVRSLSDLADRLEAPLEDDEFAGLSAERVRYHGWWTLEAFKPLGRVIPLSLTQDAFLNRCMDIYQLLERLKPGPLKRLLISLGLSKDDVKKLGDIGALRLLGTIAQLATLAAEHDEDLFEDFADIRARWDKDRRLPLLAPVFALSTLRMARGHPQGDDGKARIANALEAFGLDPQNMKAGWGRGLDHFYDVMIETLNGLAQLMDDRLR